MARARRAQTPTPDQLTLDDWAEMLSATHDSSETPSTRATSVDSLAVIGDPKQIGDGARDTVAEVPGEQATHHRPVATDLLETPGALLTRSRLRELGLERRAVDAVFRTLPVVALPGYSRPMILVQDYLDLLEHRTFHDDRVRPMA